MIREARKRARDFLPNFIAAKNAPPAAHFFGNVGGVKVLLNSSTSEPGMGLL